MALFQYEYIRDHEQTYHFLALVCGVKSSIFRPPPTGILDIINEVFLGIIILGEL